MSYSRARELGLSLSSLTQDAVERELAAATNARWVDEVRARPPRLRARMQTASLLDEVREEFGG